MRRSRWIALSALALTALLCVFLPGASQGEDGQEYTFRFNPPDGIQYVRKLKSKITEWQVFDAGLIIMAGERQRFGAYRDHRAAGWQTQSFANLARTTDREARDKMIDVRYTYTSEIGDRFQHESPGKREWKNKTRTEVEISAAADGFTLRLTPLKVKLEGEMPARTAAVAEAVKWDELTCSIDTLGGITQVTRRDVTPKSIWDTSEDDVDTSPDTFYSTVIFDELKADWNWRYDQWAGRTVSPGDMFARIDTIVVTGQETCSLEVFCLSRVVGIETHKDVECLRIAQAFDTDPRALTQAIGTIFWDVYGRELIQPPPRPDFIVCGENEILIDPETMMVYDENRMCRVSFLGPFEMPYGDDEDILIHIIEEDTHIEYRY